MNKNVVFIKYFVRNSAYHKVLYGPQLTCNTTTFVVWYLTESLPLKGMYAPVLLISCGFALQDRYCPGPGSNWGNLISPPASKDAESPSNLILLVKGGGVGSSKNQKSPKFRVVTSSNMGALLQIRSIL